MVIERFYVACLVRGHGSVPFRQLLDRSEGLTTTTESEDIYQRLRSRDLTFHHETRSPANGLFF